MQQQSEQIPEPVVQEKLEQIREPVVQEQFEQNQEPVIQEKFEPVIQEQTEQIRKPVIPQQSEQFPQKTQIWQESDQQEKVRQESTPVQHPAAIGNNRQQEIQQQQNPHNDIPNSQIQKQVPSGVFQEISDGEDSQIVTSSNNKRTQQQKQQAQSEWWIPNSSDSHPTTSSGLSQVGNNRRRPVQAPPTSLEEPILCKREGFFRHPKDCTRFVRCVKTEQGSFSVHFFQCAKQLVFDERASHCILAENNKCISRRSKRQVAGETLECNSEGFFRHPRDCRSFYRCVKQATGLYETHLFSCPDTLVFDEEYATCNWPDKSAPCETSRQFIKPKPAPEPVRPSFKPIQRTTSKPRNDFIDKTNPFTSARERSTARPKYTTQNSVSERQVLCRSPGFFRHDKDCTKFYKCVQKGNYFVRYELSCPNNFAYDENTSRCISQRYSNACNRRNTPFPPRQDDEESSPTTQATSTTSRRTQPPAKSNNDVKCEKEGYFRNPEDCNLFYRCVDFSGEGQEFVKYDFSCPEGLVFDEKSSVCTWPDPTKPCEGGAGSNEGEKEKSEDDSNETDSESVSENPPEETSSTTRSTTSRTTKGSGRRTTTPPATTEGRESTPQPEESTSIPEESTSSAGKGTKRPDDSESENGCSQEGFFRNPEDCNKFYRCVDFSGAGQEYVRYDFSCAEGLVFDEANNVCNWPSASAPCDSSTDDENEGGNENQEGSSTSNTQSGRDSTTSRAKSTTPASTTTRRSTQGGRGSTTSRPRSTTPAGTTTKKSTQGGRGSTTSRPRSTTPTSTTTKLPTDRTTSTTTKGSESSTNSERKQNDGECKEAGFFRNSNDCNKFYRCVDYNGNGEEFVKYDFSCPEGLVFDEKNSVCNWPEASEPCEGSSGNEDSSTKSNEDGVSTPSTTQGVTESSSDRVTEDSTTAASTSRPTRTTSTSRPTRTTSTSRPSRTTSTSRPTRTTSTSVKPSKSTENPSSSTAPSSSTTGDSTEDSTGKATSDGDKEEGSGECDKEGFFRNPDDCGKFYRCVDFNGDGQEFVRYDFDCPEGLYFDQLNSVCNWPEQSPACNNETDSTDEGSRDTSGTTPTSQTDSSTLQTSQTRTTTIQSTTKSDEQTTSSTTARDNSECSEPGFFRSQDDCRKFYRCVEEKGDGQQLTRYDFQCPEGLIFDDQNKKCDFPSPTLSCDSDSESTTTSSVQSTTSASRETTTTTSSTTSSTTTSKSTSAPKECTEEGYFRNPDDCSKYYRCIDEGDGTFNREEFSCADDEVFDEEMRYCNRKDLAPPCDESSTSSQSQGTTQSVESTISSEDSSKSDCTEPGFFRCPEDCNKFYRCVEDENGNGENYVRYNFTCPEGLIFDEKNKKCDWPSSELTCDEGTSTTTGTTQDETTKTTSSITSTTSSSTSTDSSSSSTSGDSTTCTEEGFFRNPDDCSKYYRCIDEGDGTFTKEDFSCADGEVFDEEMRYCNRKDLAPPCDESSTSSQSQGTTENDELTTSSTSTTKDSSKSDCTQSGFFRCPEDCNKFYRCVENENSTGENYIRYNFTCPEGLIFDERNNKCDWPSSELTCDNESLTSSSTSSSSDATTSLSSEATTSSTTSGTASSSDCTEEGFFKNPDDCRKYYRCLDEGDGTLTREDFSCAEDEVFDEEMRYCNRKDLAPPCDDNTQSTTDSSSSTTTSSTSTTDSSSSTTTSSTSTTDSSSSTTVSSASTTVESEPTDSTTKGSEESKKPGDCQEEGFHRDPQDCNKFYRCVDFEGDGQSYTRYDFVCPEGLVFDETNSVCNWPSSVPNCESAGGDNSSTTGDNDATSTSQIDDSSTSTSSMSTTTSESTTTSTSSTTAPTATDSTSTSGDRESTDSTSTSSSGTSSSDGTTSQTTSGRPSGDIECTEEGFFRNPDDCTKFYRCVDFAGTGESYVRYDFECPDDLVFDEVNKVCNWPSMTPACESDSKKDNDSKSTTTDGSATDNEASTTSGSITTSSQQTTSESTTRSTLDSTSTTGSDSNDFQCEEEGFFRDAKNCKKYYECKRDEESGELVKIDCECPEGHIFDTDGWYCNSEELSPPCMDGKFKCRDEGFFRDPEDCTKYYQCNRTGEGENDFTSERFECLDGNVFDEAGRYCNAPELSEPCEDSSNSSSTTQDSSSTLNPEQTTSSATDPNETTSSGSSTSNTGQPTGKNGECTEEGFFRNSEDCSKYYQCVRNENSGDFEKIDFECPDGRIFDEGPSYCNDPELSDEPCDSTSSTKGQEGSTDSSTSPSVTSGTGGTSTTQQTGNSSTTSGEDSENGNRNSGGDIECTQEGFFRHPDDCNKFYRCVDFSGSGESYVRYDFDCPEGLHFDEVNSVCNWPTMTPRCTSGNDSRF